MKIHYFIVAFAMMFSYMGKCNDMELVENFIYKPRFSIETTYADNDAGIPDYYGDLRNMDAIWTLGLSLTYLNLKNNADYKIEDYIPEEMTEFYNILQ